MAGRHSQTAACARLRSHVQVPIWLTLSVAALVAGFGCYRVLLALKRLQAGNAVRSNDLQTPAKPALSIMGGGMSRMSPRMHLAIGIVYVLLGAALGATSFGWNPLRGAFG